VSDCGPVRAKRHPILSIASFDGWNKGWADSKVDGEIDKKTIKTAAKIAEKRFTKRTSQKKEEYSPFEKVLPLKKL